MRNFLLEFVMKLLLLRLKVIVLNVNIPVYHHQCLMLP